VYAAKHLGSRNATTRSEEDTVARVAPGKGAFLILNEEVLNFLREALDDVKLIYTDDLHDTKPNTVLTLLAAGKVEQDGEVVELLDWTEEKDSFAKKAYAAMPYKKGELRVTVALTKNRNTDVQELKLDIREWFTPE
jgi:predicted neutral ceramidase superfamily lipid hydrolase